MDADVSIDAGPARKRRFTLRSMMLAVLAAGLLIGWGIGLNRATRRVGQATTALYALVDRIEKDDPSVSMIVINGEGQFRLDGAGATVRSRLKTPTGAEVAITIEVRSRVFLDETGTVRFESGGRSVTWPFEDLRRGRKLDLRATFPEAFPAPGPMPAPAPAPAPP